MSEAVRTDLFRALRLILAAGIGFAFTNGLIALLATGLPLLGMATSEAVLLAVVIGFLFFLLVAIWIVSTRRLLITTAVLAFMSAAMCVSAPLLNSGMIK